LQQLCCTAATVRTMLSFSRAMHQVRVKPSRLHGIRTLLLTCFLVCSLPHRSFPLPAPKCIMLLGFFSFVEYLYNDANLALFVISLYFNFCCFVRTSSIRMQQRWPSIVESISQGRCDVEFVTPSPSINLSPPAELCPRPTNTNLTTANVSRNPADTNTTIDLTILLEQSTSLLVEQQKQSTTLRHLTKLSEELRVSLSVLMSRLAIPDPCPLSNDCALDPLSHPLRPQPLAKTSQ